MCKICNMPILHILLKLFDFIMASSIHDKICGHPNRKKKRKGSLVCISFDSYFVFKHSDPDTV